MPRHVDEPVDADAYCDEEDEEDDDDECYHVVLLHCDGGVTPGSGSGLWWRGWRLELTAREVGGGDVGIDVDVVDSVRW